MSDIQNLKAKLSKLEAKNYFDALLPKTSGWFSRKLMVALAVVAALIILGRDNMSSIINWIGFIAIAYIVSQAVHDVFSSRDDRISRCKLIDAMAKDGLTKEEIASLPSDHA
jgi:hypothetical protein